jgi:hypothetical protein
MIPFPSISDNYWYVRLNIISSDPVIVLRDLIEQIETEVRPEQTWIYEQMHVEMLRHQLTEWEAYSAGQPPDRAIVYAGGAGEESNGEGDPRELKLEDLEMSVRAYNALKNADLNTLGDVAALTKDKFEKIKNLGRRSQSEVMNILSAHGLPLKAQPTASEAIKIDDIKLSARSYNAIKDANIMTLGAVAALTESELGVLTNFGKRSLSEVKTILAAHGLSLRGNPPITLETKPNRRLRVLFDDGSLYDVFMNFAAAYGFNSFKILQEDTVAGLQDPHKMIGVEFVKRKEGGKWQVVHGQLVVRAHFVEALERLYKEERPVDEDIPLTKQLLQSLLRVEQARIEKGERIFNYPGKKTIPEIVNEVTLESYRSMHPGTAGKEDQLNNLARFIWFSHVVLSPLYAEMQAPASKIFERHIIRIVDSLELIIKSALGVDAVAEPVTKELVQQIIQTERGIDLRHHQPPETTIVFAGGTGQDSEPNVGKRPAAGRPSNLSKEDDLAPDSSGSQGQPLSGDEGFGTPKLALAVLAAAGVIGLGALRAQPIARSASDFLTSLGPTGQDVIATGVGVVASVGGIVFSGIIAAAILALMGRPFVRRNADPAAGQPAARKAPLVVHYGLWLIKKILFAVGGVIGQIGVYKILIGFLPSTGMVEFVMLPLSFVLVAARTVWKARSSHRKKLPGSDSIRGRESSSPPATAPWLRSNPFSRAA